MSLILKSYLYSTYTCSTSWADVGMSIIIPEDGYYSIFGVATHEVDDNDGTQPECKVRLVKNGNAIIGSSAYGFIVTSANNLPYYYTSCIPYLDYFLKDDVIIMHAKMGAGNNSQIRETGENYTTKIEAYKLNS